MVPHRPQPAVGPARGRAAVLCGHWHHWHPLGIPMAAFFDAYSVLGKDYFRDFHGTVKAATKEQLEGAAARLQRRSVVPPWARAPWRRGSLGRAAAGRSALRTPTSMTTPRVKGASGRKITHRAAVGRYKSARTHALAAAILCTRTHGHVHAAAQVYHPSNSHPRDLYLRPRVVTALL